MVKRVRFNLKQLMEKTTTATTTTTTITTTTTEPRPDASNGRIMSLLRQRWLVKQKIMHYGLFEQCFSEYHCS